MVDEKEYNDLLFELVQVKQQVREANQALAEYRIQEELAIDAAVEEAVNTTDTEVHGSVLEIPEGVTIKKVVLIY